MDGPACIVIKTFSPMLIPFAFRTGTMHSLPEYRSFLDKIRDFDPGLRVEVTPVGSREYTDLSADVRSLAVAEWCDCDSGQPLTIHVFPNSVGIAEISFDCEPTADTKEREQRVQHISVNLIKAAYPRCVELMQALRSQVRDPVLGEPEDSMVRAAGPRIFWTSRALLLKKSSLRETAWAALRHGCW